MGAINYGTSNYITMGIVPYDRYEMEEDKDLMEWLCDGMDADPEECLSDYINILYEEDYSNAESIIEKYNIHYWRIELKNGYYDGFYLDIEDNYGIAFDDWTDRAEAQKEVTQIKNMLYELAGVGMVKCAPGWSTGYSSYNETLKAIDEAVKDMREEVKTKPTMRQYLIDCGEWDYKQERAWRRVYA